MSEHPDQNRVAHPVAGDDAILARRYVGALYALAAEDDMVDVVATDLRGLRRLWDESAEWRFVAQDPRLSIDYALRAVDQVGRISDLDELTFHFLSVLAQHRRLPLLPMLVEAFLDEVATKRGEYRADVRTARPLSVAQRDALVASLNGIAGGKVHVTVTEDAGLLGGLTVKIGSRFIDASVKSRLEKLERSLRAGAVA